MKSHNCIPVSEIAFILVKLGLITARSVFKHCKNKDFATQQFVKFGIPEDEYADVTAGLRQEDSIDVNMERLFPDAQSMLDVTDEGVDHLFANDISSFRTPSFPVSAHNQKASRKRTINPSSTPMDSTAK